MQDIADTIKQRGENYGDWALHAQTLQALLDVLQKHPNWEKLSPYHKECFRMTLFKISRYMCGNPWYPDNAHDIAGYNILLEDVIKQNNDTTPQQWIGGAMTADGKIFTTLEQRGSKYGNFSDNARTTQRLMEVLRSHCRWDELPYEHIECFHMIFHKISRAINGDQWYTDNPHDIAGYATLLEEVIHEYNSRD